MIQQFKVRITEAAWADVRDIRDWIRDDRGPEAADNFVDSMLARVETLERFPLRGAVPPELQALGIAEFRQQIVGIYRILYRIDEDRVSIVLIADGRRDLERLFERRLLRRDGE